MNIYERQISILGMEFDRYMREHPEFSEKFPQNAHIVLLKHGDKKFNEWCIELANKQKDEEQPIIYITIKKMVPAYSRIKELELSTGLT